MTDAPNRRTAEQSPRALVVDDNDINRTLFGSMLERLGFDVLHAVDGEEGVEVARAEHPALILMDLAMPRKDGFAATRELKADASTTRIPIIAVTALAMPEDARRAFEAGVDGYLSKPIDRAAFESEIARLLDPTR